MILSTGDIPNKYKIVDLVFASGDSTQGIFKSCQPIAAYQKVSQLLGEVAQSVGADAVINIKLDFRVAVSQGILGNNQAFEVFGYGTAVKLLS